VPASILKVHKLLKAFTKLNAIDLKKIIKLNRGYKIGKKDKLHMEGYICKYFYYDYSFISNSWN
jgi:hypothetical protein